jgi:hypothetical protein
MATFNLDGRIAVDMVVPVKVRSSVPFGIGNVRYCADVWHRPHEDRPRAQVLTLFPLGDRAGTVEVLR